MCNLNITDHTTVKMSQCIWLFLCFNRSLCVNAGHPKRTWKLKLKREVLPLVAGVVLPTKM